MKFTEKCYRIKYDLRSRDAFKLTLPFLRPLPAGSANRAGSIRHCGGGFENIMMKQGMVKLHNSRKGSLAGGMARRFLRLGALPGWGPAVVVPGGFRRQLREKHG